MKQPDPLESLFLPNFPGDREADVPQNHLRAFYEQMEFQLQNNTPAKGDWFAFVSQPGDLSAKLIAEIENHADKLVKALVLYSTIRDQPMQPVVRRYFFQLIAEYAADTANSAMFAFVSMLTNPQITDALEATPAIEEDYNDPMREYARSEALKLIHEVRFAQTGKIMAGLSTKGE